MYSSRNILIRFFHIVPLFYMIDVCILSNKCFWILNLESWTNGWATSLDAGDLRRNPAHYEFTVMYNFTNNSSHCSGKHRVYLSLPFISVSYIFIMSLHPKTDIILLGNVLYFEPRDFVASIQKPWRQFRNFVQNCCYPGRLLWTKNQMLSTFINR